MSGAVGLGQRIRAAGADSWGGSTSNHGLDLLAGPTGGREVRADCSAFADSRRFMRDHLSFERLCREALPWLYGKSRVLSQPPGSDTGAAALHPEASEEGAGRCGCLRGATRFGHPASRQAAILVTAAVTVTHRPAILATVTVTVTLQPVILVLLAVAVMGPLATLITAVVTVIGPGCLVACSTAELPGDVVSEDETRQETLDDPCTDPRCDPRCRPEVLLRPRCARTVGRTVGIESGIYFQGLTPITPRHAIDRRKFLS